MKMPHLIGLHGPKTCGKSTVARALAGGKNIPQPAKVLSFADPIRDMLGALIGKDISKMTQAEKEDPNLGICGVSVRRLMQTIGVEWGRKLIHPEIWLEIMRRRIQESGAATVIIDDLRFDEEANMVSDLGGVVCQLVRDGVTYTGEHATEHPIAGELIDFVLANDTLQQLSDMVEFWEPVAMEEAAKARHRVDTMTVEELEADSDEQVLQRVMQKCRVSMRDPGDHE